MTQRRYPSLPPLPLAVDLSSADYTIKTTQSLDWESSAIILGMFNSDYVPFCLMNDAKNRVEFGLITASTLTALSTTGATIYKRGLKTYAEGKSTDSDEVTANKLPWIAGETKLLIGTNPPWMYGTFTNKANDEVITGDWTFNVAPTVPTIAPGVLTRVANLQSVSDWVDAIGVTSGQILSWSGGVKTLITPGVAGTVLTSNGVASLPSFQSFSVVLPVEDEGIQITPSVSKFNFVGTGVTASAVGNDVTVTIPGGGASVPVKDEGVQITAGVTSFDFVGSGVTATAVGGDVTVTIPAPTSVAVKDEGVLLTPGVTSIDFVGTGVTATTVGNNVTVTIPSNTGNMKFGTGHVRTDTGTTPPLVIAHGLGVTPKFIRFTAKMNLIGSSPVESVGIYDGITNSCVYEGFFSNGDNGNGSSNTFICVLQTSNSVVFYGTVTSMDATNINISFLGIAGKTWMNYLWEAYA